MGLSRLIGKTVLNWVSVATKKKRSVAPLQRDGKPLEELLYLQVRREVLPGRAMSGNGLEGLDSRGVPPTECFYHERLEEKPGVSTVDGVLTDLFVFPHLDGGSCVDGGPVDDRVLGWWNDAYIESHPSSVGPLFHEDVGRSWLSQIT